MSKPPHNQRGQQIQQRPQNPQPQRQQQGHVAVHQKVEAWSGPLPPPEVIERFNQIVPNGADRIVKMAEAEQAHRISYEAKGLDASTKEARRGQYLGAGISVLAIAAAAFTAYIGASPWVSGAFLGITLLGIINAVVRPRAK